jgi:oligopeptide transport system permease protein
MEFVEKIEKEQFQFVQREGQIHDQKLETKARGYFADAMIRFRKNKSSVIAAWVLLFLVLYAIFAPILSPYTIEDTDGIYYNAPAYVPAIADMNLGIMDGSRELPSQTEQSMNAWRGIAEETGYNPVVSIVDTVETEVKVRGQIVKRMTYTIRTNRYFEPGVVYRTMSYEEFANVQQWQNETGIQVIYPYVDASDINGITDQPNVWYKCDKKGAAILDKNGNLQPVYSTRADKAGAEYNSMRIEGDPGNYVYSFAVSGAVKVRVCYYNYYQYKFGMEPTYIFGTDVVGRDLFGAIGQGARFSIIFAILVSAINLTLGAIYGAIQGYYGGMIDMILDRISDILSGVPFIVVATLFQFHLVLTGKVSSLTAFLFAFVLTGWIGMAALTRKQFYRFKSQEFVMAARTLGASDRRLMFKHIFPNGLGTMITSCALVIPGVIGSETSLTYLGIVDLNSMVGCTLGTLLSSGQASMTTAPHAMLWPSVYLALLMICFNLFGNGLRDAFNPSMRGVED